MLIDAESTADNAPPLNQTPATPTLVLLYVGGAAMAAPYRIPIDQGVLALGRAVESSAGFSLNDKRASRVHATVQCDATGLLRVMDANSRNGTFVNGERITDVALQDGDILRVGDSLFMARLERSPIKDSPCSYLVGCSRAAVQLRNRLARVAATTATVLLLGETGTGKEVAARYLHEHGGRRGPLVTVNASALPESLVESLLFGHTRGAFSGAEPHTGFFRAAHHGTLFFDEIGELPLALQPKLLRVLEERIVYPVGAVTGQALDLRFVFATNRNLAEAVFKGKFRADLYARMAELVIELTPLRHRREDIFQLVQHATPNGQPLELSPKLAEAMLLYDWPFNIRELVKLVFELAVTKDSEVIAERLSQPPPTSELESEPEPEPKTRLQVPSRDQLLKLMNAHHGNIAAVARKLGTPRKYVYRWIKEHDLNLEKYRE